MRRIVVCLIALVLPSGYASANPQPIVKFDLQYYPVDGETIIDINTSMFSRTPIRTAGGPFAAVTESGIRATYDLLNEADGGCSVRNPVVHLETKMILPKLSPGQRRPNVNAEWTRFIGALRAHELMHAQNGLAISKTVLKRITGFRTSLSCAETSGRLNAAIQQLIGKMNEYDKHLDKTTNHGETQGTKLNIRIR